MADEKLKDFAKRLERTRQVYKGAGDSRTEEASALGLATRAVTELVVGIGVAMGLGWLVDRYFDTRPLFMLILLPIGLAAGVLNVMRLGNSKQATDLVGGKPGVPPAPSVKDEDED